MSFKEYWPGVPPSAVAALENLSTAVVRKIINAKRAAKGLKPYSALQFSGKVSKTTKGERNART